MGDQTQFAQVTYADLILSDPDQTNIFKTEPIGWTESLPAGVYELVVHSSVVELTPGNLLFSSERGRCESSVVLALTAAETPPPGPCGADLDGDGDTDILDFALFQQCFGGPRP